MGEVETTRSWSDYFFGAVGGSEPPSAIDKARGMISDVEAYKSRSGTDLFYAVIYLSPKDYHRIHAPVPVHLTKVTHTCGHLLSVNPKVLDWIPDLFVLNERVLMKGIWAGGFFGIVAVGATNVGKIVVNSVPEVNTNTKMFDGTSGIDQRDNLGTRSWEVDEWVDKGAEIGGFKMGICEIGTNCRVDCRSCVRG